MNYIKLINDFWTSEETADIVQRDRSTVFNMLNNMSNLLLYDEPTKAIYEKITNKVKE